ncbi:putative subtilisin [Colletotrichum musicola]|uniref:Putative subtilisin n=1 Tax=Colletotrichum musicola TaxID=2175873 RepID=A0A8H6MZJ6_9PEZI|nr:putative subtilisin [Colletotrichum musicola]
MSNNVAVDFGADGDSVDPFDFAKEALSRVSQIAVDLGARKKLCLAGCILSFSKSSPKIIEQYFQKLERFSRQVVQLPDENARGGEKVKQLAKDIKEYPAHVFTNLHAVLKNKTAKAVKFGDEPDHLSSLKRPEKKTRVVKPEEFCGLVKTKWASRICCRVQDSELHQLYDGLPLVENVDSGPSISLRKLLEIGRLSNRMKIVLAFIVARSFWQYYDSSWMDSPWSSNSIHFLPELVVEDEHDQPSVALYASKPYFAVQFLQHAGESVEYCSAFGVVCRYPRLLALRIILLEIGRGQSLTIEDHGSVEANLNANWTLAKRLTNKNRTWGDFDYPHYRQAILGCLNYNYSEQAGASVETNVFARKAAVYEAVLQPLEKLINELGFAENMNIMDPIDASQGPDRIADVPAPPAMPMQNSAVAKASQWLNDLNAINRYFHKRCPLASVPSPRVAILDTGFDDEGAFFSVPGRRQKVKGWKDFAADSEVPVDDNGHGSHCIALIMKVAPHATIYVARIAKDRGSLRNAAQAIADAIDWAAHEVKADIVSMSFGFKDEVPVITQAITKAMLERHGKIIFLAATSNSGGNRREMFPANLDSVISIRETNTLGAFSDTNPPVDPDGPAVLGTLGRDVPSAWLSSAEGEVAKSGSSVATAVSAGIAAMIMTIMSICCDRGEPSIGLPRAPRRASAGLFDSNLIYLTRLDGSTI